MRQEKAALPDSRDEVEQPDGMEQLDVRARAEEMKEQDAPGVMPPGGMPPVQRREPVRAEKARPSGDLPWVVEVSAAPPWAAEAWAPQAVVARLWVARAWEARLVRQGLAAMVPAASQLEPALSPLSVRIAQSHGEQRRLRCRPRNVPGLRLAAPWQGRPGRHWHSWGR
jgi:hypothetical protein